MNLSKTPLAKLLGEGVLIIVAVYLAIVLEGISQDRSAKLAAHTALAQMLGEIRADVDEIRILQSSHDRQYLAIDEWLATPGSIPLDLMAEAFEAIFVDNRTLYPRRSAWTTMIAAGQLSELDAPRLVRGLGDFYESATARIIDNGNGNDFDEVLNDLGRNSAP